MMIEPSTDPAELQRSYLAPLWPEKPAVVQAYTTLLTGGVSRGDYAGFNLAAHVGDDPVAVSKNRRKLVRDLNLPAEPVWLEQVHSNKVHLADSLPASPPQADASVSRHRGIASVVLTADCLPVFICNRAGTEVAAVHAGWRGLHAGIISNTVAVMRSPVADLLVSFGPAIGALSFEVGAEVRQAFVDLAQDNNTAFSPGNEGRYLCDIYQLARNELQRLGMRADQISGGGLCTCRDRDRFYSYRRQQKTGRMANLIWFS